MDDFDRLRSEDPAETWQEPVAEPSPSRAAWIALAMAVLVIAAGSWWWASRPTAVPSPAVVAAPTAPSSPEASTQPIRGLGIGEPDPALPAMGGLDAYVRPLLAALTARPELAALLATDDLVRRFVVSVETVARGASPAGQVRAVAPRGPFRVRPDGGAMVVDPASFARYDGLTLMVEDLDPQDLARLYGRIKPRLDEAYAELGVEGTFDEVMARALRHLLATPDVPASARLEPSKGINYVYVDPNIEGLSAAQRQLLRLGPARAARVKEHLRRFGVALGIPAEQLG